MTTQSEFIQWAAPATVPEFEKYLSTFLASGKAPLAEKIYKRHLGEKLREGANGSSRKTLDGLHSPEIEEIGAKLFGWEHAESLYAECVMSIDSASS